MAELDRHTSGDDIPALPGLIYEACSQPTSERAHAQSENRSSSRRPRMETIPVTPWGAHRTEEHPTDNGPADYVLHLDDSPVAVGEAKKLTVGPQNVLTQAQRYARGLRSADSRFGEYGVPFLYSTNGEVTWFHDVRHPLNLSRQVANFHTPGALHEALDRDFEGQCRDLGDSISGIRRSAPISAMPITPSRTRSHRGNGGCSWPWRCEAFCDRMQRIAGSEPRHREIPKA